jgi:hypothetical protein
MSRPVAWLLENPRRLLTLAWLVGIMIVGLARTASADIITGPDLAQGGPKTLYEMYDFADYKLTVKPDEEHSDWAGVGQGVLEVVGFLNNLIMWVCLGILYGALSLLEWFLNLSLYRDSAAQIDTATQMIANEVFWPLIAATVAVGAFIAYARWRGEGRGFISDFGWIVAAGTLAVGFAAGPSTIMNNVDSLRQDLATGVISGSSHYASTAINPTGFPTPPIGGEPQKAGTRKLVDSVWNTFGATAWCFAEFRDLEICKIAGHHALANDDQWKQWMAELDDGGAPQIFGAHVHWIRGQDMTRTGYIVVLALITVPMGLMLLRLVISGLITVVGFLLMLVIGLVFLVFWPIPGWFRQVGTRYWVYTIGMELQGLFITVVISGGMVVSATVATQAGKYGFFVVALLNLGIFAAAGKARTWLEMLTTFGGAGSMGYATALLARSAVRTVASGVGGLVGGGLGLAGLGLRGAGRLGSKIGRGPGWGNQPGMTTSRWGVRTVTTPRATPMSGLEPDTPISATAMRMRPPGNDPALPGRQPAALPPGRTAGPHTASGAARSPSAPTTAPLGPRRLGAASTSPDVVDATAARDRTLTRNVAKSQAKTGKSGRVWIDQKGTGLSALDNPPGPKPARQKGGVHQITTARPPRRTGSKGGKS